MFNKDLRNNLLIHTNTCLSLWIRVWLEKKSIKTSLSKKEKFDSNLKITNIAFKNY